MTKKRFYLYRVGSRKIIYARLIDPETGVAVSGKSTGTSNKDEALLIIGKWLENGVPSGATHKPARRVFGLASILAAIRNTEIGPDEAAAIVSELRARGCENVALLSKREMRKGLCAELILFWNYETSAFVKEAALQHGKPLTRRHCEDMTRCVRNYWAGAFGDKAIDEVTRDDLKAFGLSLRQSGKSAAYTNKVLNAGARAFAFWHSEGLIPTNPALKLGRFSGGKKLRGILTEAEAATLFSRQWADTTAQVANLVASTTGLRAGEVLAIQARDIGEAVLEVRHSWSSVDGLKTPKNGETRRVPLLPEVREALLWLLTDNPHGNGPDAFIFWGERPDRPRYDAGFMLRGLDRELDALGIDRKGRNVVFHSWRHYCATRWAMLESADRVRLMTGHRDQGTFEAYASHASEADIAELGRKAARAEGFAFCAAAMAALVARKGGRA
ncbi:MAG: tyrosine-type recombinase/integrase [Treponematales bacterium]